MLITGLDDQNLFFYLVYNHEFPEVDLGFSTEPTQVPLDSVVAASKTDAGRLEGESCEDPLVQHGDCTP